MLTETVQALIYKFTGDLNYLIETEAEAIRERISGAIASMTSTEDPKATVKLLNGPITAGINNGHAVALSNIPVTAGIENDIRKIRNRKIRSRKPRAVFLCLRKNCKNVGAPIYGMVCTKHKNTPKATIAKLKARRAARSGSQHFHQRHAKLIGCGTRSIGSTSNSLAQRS